MSKQELIDKTCAMGAQFGAMATQQLSKGLFKSAEFMQSVHEKMTNKCNDNTCQSETKHDNHNFEAKMHAQSHQQQNQHQHNHKSQNHKHH